MELGKREYNVCMFMIPYSGERNHLKDTLVYAAHSMHVFCVLFVYGIKLVCLRNKAVGPERQEIMPSKVVITA